MRNDVKLGFAIGGVLLAVLIVYVLVVPGGSNARQTKLDPAKPDGKVTLEPVPTTQAGAPPAAPAGTFNPAGSLAESATDDPDVAAPESEVALADEETPEPPPPAKAKDIDWNKLLNGQPVLMTTPQPIGDTQLTQGGEGRSSPPTTPMPRVPPLEPERPSTPQVEAPPTQPDDAPPPVKVSDASPPPAKLSVPPAPFSSRTHVVQANETLSSIAIAAYGNANYWPAIVKANPGIDPNRMKVGATIKLPELKDIKSAEPQNASARVGPTAAAVTIDPTRQYRVESGDNLHNIALKLYGKSTLGDKIYELNKQTIGPDPARLKIGQVLQLPEPPSGSASR